MSQTGSRGRDPASARSRGGYLAGAALALLLGGAAAAQETAAQTLTRQGRPPARDLSSESNASLYAIGYAHLDTQWRWDFVTTIDEFLRNTLDDNFELFEKYPNYVFNFTGSTRYEMMKEYYPERYERLKGYVAAGRWRLSGSSVDEGDVNVPSPESTIRQVLYGNLFFEREFGKVSSDFMLPDCFGFPWSMPSIWAHCGLLGFSTQKLTWGSAVGIPFPLGVWEGPDGRSVMAALDPGAYVSAIRDSPPDASIVWADRIRTNGSRHATYADFHYYGVGDVGGAPREEDVRTYTAAAAREGDLYDVVLAGSDDLFFDITPEQRAELPRYAGDMLLTEHSAGTLTSQSYVKRWNRRTELLADAAERAATAAWWLGLSAYPRAILERAWVRHLGNQMHDILPGTSVPRAYTYSWNDQVLAMNIFSDVLTSAVGDVASMMDTGRARGTPVVVYNPLAFSRTDLVEASVDLGGRRHARVFGPGRKEVPAQIIAREGDAATVLFEATLGPTEMAVYDIRPSAAPFEPRGGAGVTAVTMRSIENEHYLVTLDDAGDIASVFDKAAGRELLAEPAGLVFTYEKPREFPAWNMDWDDRRQPPTGRVDGRPTFRIVEDGPLRVALAVTRAARNSVFTQTVRLASGEAGRVVEVHADIDWQTNEATVKAAFPLTVSNPEATYSWGLGTIERGNNNPVKYEVPSHEWFALTDASGDYGVTILEDSKYGSDKPSDNELRLTLLFTPGVRDVFLDQHSQDWGRHEMRYGISGHAGGWRGADSERLGRRFNQRPMAFVVENPSRGPLGESFSFASIDRRGIDVRAIKIAERRDSIIVRVREMHGRVADDASIEFAGRVLSVREVDGQERAIPGEPVEIDGPRIRFGLTPYLTKAFEVELAPPTRAGREAQSRPVPLSFNADVVSENGVEHAGDAMDAHGRTFPAEQFDREIVSGGVRFELGDATGDAAQAVVARGQTIVLPEGGDRVHLLMAATEDLEAEFLVGDEPRVIGVQGWTGFLGQWDDRVWDREHGTVDFVSEGRVVAIQPGYTRRDPVAWFATHRHTARGGGESYRFSYLYRYGLDRPRGADTLTLPVDERIRVFAVTVADDPARAARPVAPLYDTLEDHEPIAIRHDYERFGLGSEVQVVVDNPDLFEDLESAAGVVVARSQSFDRLGMPPPSTDDDIDRSTGEPFVFRFFDGEGAMRPHLRAGAVGNTLPRLNDGLLARSNDDTERTAWFDRSGRFGIDLLRARDIASIRTYSWHVIDRGPQWFTLWGSDAEEMPDPYFTDPGDTDWSFIATVDSRQLGLGDWKHGSEVSAEAGIGPYRWLLWIAPAKTSGTFFTEIDIDFKDGDG